MKRVSVGQGSCVPKNKSVYCVYLCVCLSVYLCVPARNVCVCVRVRWS